MKNSASTMQRMVTILCCSVIFFAANSVKVYAQETAQPIEGRWDITFNMDGKATPAWMEVRHSGVKTLVGDVMVAGGSARPISKVNFADGKFSFSVPPQWEKGDGDLTIEGTLQNDDIAGTITYPDGKTYKFTGVRAPALIRTSEPEWGAPIQLFNGKNLQGWHASGETNQWVAEDGVLRSPKSGSNIISDAMFTDFKLHVEFRYPEHSNSGVYLRGRYEVQVMDSKG
ncbi:MAG TPA: DUF1080 domain-containing protein, partial [Chitinophagaceae bacterium]|nr:DUF1080 domain-containing protein [Chitinophagaceae bacterium]